MYIKDRIEVVVKRKLTAEINKRMNIDGDDLCQYYLILDEAVDVEDGEFKVTSIQAKKRLIGYLVDQLWEKLKNTNWDRQGPEKI